jgi:hypothetical protein
VPLLTGSIFAFALRYHPRARRSFATALLVLAIALPAQAADITGRASVFDGDTIDIHGQRIYCTQYRNILGQKDIASSLTLSFSL